mmetsp:Transcript_46256/g.112104  ORF Transcript_46256/g.112104 Transcript_46256/m.112104 type:complete len:93 (+) Transcript_46256:287-565(+)
MEDENGRYVEMTNREAISKTMLCFDYLNKQPRIIVNPTPPAASTQSEGGWEMSYEMSEMKELADFLFDTFSQEDNAATRKFKSDRSALRPPF